MSGRPTGEVRYVVVPGCLALLPEYAGQEDPVAPLRAAALDAVAALGDAVVLASSPQAVRVGAHLLSAAGHAAVDELPAQWSGPFLVVANGSAKRTDKAPGHFDERAEAFDAEVAERIRTGGAADLDAGLAADLWADVAALADLERHLVLDPATVEVTYDDDPYGVQYWVVRGTGVSRR
ncbi:MAG: hypothetical protein ACI379_17200 [Nocardioides sp.]|uniref:hypothetical protein n=1 Tax=Nocardioides sp. TaxID=35761 RepID=UPI003F028AA5